MRSHKLLIVSATMLATTTLASASFADNTSAGATKGTTSKTVPSSGSTTTTVTTPSSPSTSMTVTTPSSPPSSTTVTTQEGAMPPPPTTSTTTLTSAQVGNVSDRKIVVVNGNAIYDNIYNDGAGILVVTGQLTLRRNADYRGLIVCIGQGSVVAEGWDHGLIKGALLVAKTRDASNNLLATLGNPTYDLRSDQETDINYSASEIAAGLPAAQQRFIKKSWRKFF